MDFAVYENCADYCRDRTREECSADPHYKTCKGELTEGGEILKCNVSHQFSRVYERFTCQCDCNNRITIKDLK